MGIARKVSVAGAGPSWERIQKELQGLGETPALRMIDNLPAFPEEIPEAGWKELRLGLCGGMVTLRKAPGEWSCTIWGTGDPKLEWACEAVAWAIATAEDQPESAGWKLKLESSRSALQ